MDINNREVASLVWIAIAIAAILLWPAIRPSAMGVVSALFHRAFAIVFSLAAIYILACIAILSWTGVWTSANLKETIPWVVTFACLTIFTANRINEGTAYFLRTVRETISITALFVFITQLESFSLIAELLLLPFVTVISLMFGLAESKPEYQQVRGLLGCMLGVIGFSYLGFSVYETLADWEKFSTAKTLRELFVPICLSLMFLPFLYALNIYSEYERVFTTFHWAIDDDDLRWFAKRRAIWTFGTNLKQLDRWRHEVLNERPTDRTGVRQTIEHVKRMQAREAAQAAVATNVGWSPYLAKDFLASFGLPTRDYHRSFKDEWFASSTYVAAGDKTALLTNNLCYYVSGTEIAAQRLKLNLKINTPDGAEVAERHYRDAGVALVTAALGPGIAEQVAPRIEASESFGMEFSNGRVTAALNGWVGRVTDGYDRSLIIERGYGRHNDA
jgi:hypothetical protein